MSKIIVPTSCNIDLAFEIPPFHHRFFAWLIDFFVILGYIWFAFKLIDSFTTNHQSHDNDMSYWYNMNSIQVIAFTPVLLYHLFCELLLNGQSVGKRALSIKVISETGRNASLDQYLVRWLLRIVDFGISGGAIGFITALATKSNKRIGDIAAGTLIIKTKIKSDLTNSIFQEVSNTYVPVYANVLRLSDRDMNVIKTILDNSRNSSNHEMAERASAKIRTVLNITNYQNPMDFLETILKDYNYLANK